MVKDLEHSLAKESERAEDFKAKLSQSREEVSRLELSLSEANGEMASIQKKLESINALNEDLTCQLADLSGNAASKTETLTKRNESLQKMVRPRCRSGFSFLPSFVLSFFSFFILPQMQLLETDKGRRERQISELEAKLSQTCQEYESYKVRAQNILKQSKESEVEKKQQSEILTLERTVECLNERINDLK